MSKDHRGAIQALNLFLSHRRVLLPAGLLLLFAASLQSAPLMVTTTADSGPGSLRQALINANLQIGADTIRFDIRGAGVHMLSLATELPAIVGPVSIDGTTQPGYAGQPLIELNGTGTLSNGLTILGGGSTVRGLIFAEFTGPAIRLEENGGNLIIGNFIGVDDTGTNIAGNGLGILIGPNCPLNTIGGRDPASRNVISGNRTGGIQISAAASGNVIQGNYIGTDRSGSVSCANGFAGIVVSNGVRNTVGGVRAGDGNLLSGNSGSGLALLNGAAENQVQGNIIGLTQSGEVALPNARHGIELQEAWDNTLGGPQPGAANVISGNGESGLRLSGSDSQRNVIQGNLIGLNATGTAALGNGRFGVEIQDGQSITIGGVEPGSGNVISGNAWSGVSLSGQGHVVQGNQIGTDLSGTRALPNSTASDGGSGLHIEGAEHTIGGSVAGRNLISGNALHGVTLAGSNVVVQGNLIGTDRSGAHRLGNGAAGIQLVQAAANNTIGGAGVDERNVISGNEAEGVRLEGPQVELNAVQGNLIGLAADGKTALGNGSYGVTVANGHDNLIGGSDPAQGNVIAANRAGGVRMEGEADGLIVQGNWIGTDETGAMPQPNAGPGIWIESPARNSFIGGRTPGTGNRIAFNEADGVLIRGESAVGHTIVGNSLEANWGLAINLEWNGVAPGPVTPNDALDSDLGPNGLQNFPVITNITFNAGVTAVRGLLASAPEHDYAIDVYHSAAADPSGFGEGAVYAGEVVVTTDRQGLAGFAFFMVGEVTDRRFSVTATDLDTDSTSEFGLAFPNHDALPQLTIADLTVSEDDRRNGLAVFTVRLSEPTNRRVSVTCQTADGTARAGLDYVATNRILTFAPGEASATLAVVLLADSAVEPEETFFVNLSEPVNAAIADNSAQATIFGLYLTSVRLVGADVQIGFQASAGGSYVVEKRDDLAPGGSWISVGDGTPIAGAGGIVTVLDPNAARNPARFYRVRLVP